MKIKTIFGVYEYQNKLKILLFCSNNKDNKTDSDYTCCYNYLVYTKFIKNLDRATQMMIYYKQKDFISFNTGSLVDRYVALFLLNKPGQMDKLFGQMTENKQNKNDEIHQGYKKLLKGQKPDQKILNQLLVSLSKLGYTMGVKILLE